jgi:hypothetical protein
MKFGDKWISNSLYIVEKINYVTIGFGRLRAASSSFKTICLQSKNQPKGRVQSPAAYPVIALRNSTKHKGETGSLSLLLTALKRINLLPNRIADSLSGQD